MQASLLFAPFLQAPKEHGASHYLQDSGTLYNSSSRVLVFLHRRRCCCTCSSRIHKDAVLSRDAYSGYFAPFLLCTEHGGGPLTQLRQWNFLYSFSHLTQNVFICMLFSWARTWERHFVAQQDDFMTPATRQPVTTLYLHVNPQIVFFQTKAFHIVTL